MFGAGDGKWFMIIQANFNESSDVTSKYYANSRRKVLGKWTHVSLFIWITIVSSFMRSWLRISWLKGWKKLRYNFIIFDIIIKSWFMYIWAWVCYLLCSRISFEFWKALYIAVGSKFIRKCSFRQSFFFQILKTKFTHKDLFSFLFCFQI